MNLRSAVFATVVLSWLTLDITFAAVTALSCDSAKNITLTCLMDEMERIYLKSAAIEGNVEPTCDSALISEQTCDICRELNASKGCLEILLDSCPYREIHDFLWTVKVPYLGTVASLCNFGNVISEIHDNKECYSGITSNLRKCFSTLDVEPSCWTANKGYTCSMKMAEVYCASLFNQSADHRLLTQVFLRVLEPMIDLQNCSDQSELYIAQVYPEFQYRWKKEPTSAKTRVPPEKQLNFGFPVLYRSFTLPACASSNHLIFLCLTFTVLAGCAQQRRPL